MAIQELRDNVGSVSVALSGTKVSGQADLYKYNDYYPYGSIAQSGGQSYRYDYQGAYAEKDPVPGYNDFELRMYDARIGRWLSTDPKGQFSSRYLGMGNQPITGIDKDGGYWVPDSQGNLIAEKGDNAASLAKFLNTDLNDANQMINSQLNGSVTPGNKIILDNVFTRSISNFDPKVMLGYAKGYNCWGSAITGSIGQEINPQTSNKIGEPETFNIVISSLFKATNSSDAEFGKTVLRLSTSDNITQDGAVFYGKDTEGNTYVYTKNGWFYAPTIMKLTDLIDISNTYNWNYGNVKGLKQNESGYYNNSLSDIINAALSLVF